MPRAPRPDDLFEPARPDPGPDLAGRDPGRLHRSLRSRPARRRLSARPLDRAGGRVRPGPAADARPSHRYVATLEPRWSDAGLPERSRRGLPGGRRSRPPCPDARHPRRAARRPGCCRWTAARRTRSRGSRATSRTSPGARTGGSLCVVSASLTDEAPCATRPPEATPDPDIRQIDRLFYQLNGAGFTYDRPGKLWRIDLDSGDGAPSDLRPRG